jgi:hypothetical protein
MVVGLLCDLATMNHVSNSLEEWSACLDSGSRRYHDGGDEIIEKLRRNKNILPTNMTPHHIRFVGENPSTN